MEIEVTRPDRDTLENMGVFSWPVWTCEPSTFDWTYDMKEVCYILEGAVTVEYDGGETNLGPGDLVTFAEGLECVWKVSRAVRKHYTFE